MLEVVGKALDDRCRSLVVVGGRRRTQRVTSLKCFGSIFVCAVKKSRILILFQKNILNICSVHWATPIKILNNVQ